ncbi:hypothetical protein [Polaribacter porphyrae]|uniref:Lipocalin-like domain-containing protein n=1 Tax=Polaribacter porphyrae TaxID=1137780 RepID=A0A2S7WM75_9FLAO|nr:hypothetical protein [Polaribacter porphyrae]PQJ78556.1 hypothetical protein BTO18_04855 [Polaribacter porphyrae]
MKLKHFLIIAFLATFTACDTDDNLNISITEADLIGTWNLKEQRIEDGSVSYVSSGKNITALYSAYAKEINMTLTFADNPKKASTEGKYTIVATATYNGRTETEEEEVYAINDPNENPNWELDGNNITFSNDKNIPANLVVDSYDGKTLRLKAIVNQTEKDGLESITIKGTMYMVLEK